MTITTLKWR